MRNRYKTILKLSRKFSYTEIATKLGYSRAMVQRYRWLIDLTPKMREAFFSGRLAERHIFPLWRLRDDRKAMNAAFRALPERTAFPPRIRTVGEIRMGLLNPSLDSATLQWVLGTN